MVSAIKSVSVIIPTFNRAGFVVEAIESVLRQDIENCDIQVIVVDDGSTDGTKKAIERFGGAVNYVYQENSGAGAARNRGIREAQAEWIAFLDSDDRWLPHKLSLQFRVLEAFPNYNVIHSNFYTTEHGMVTIPKGLEYWVQCITGAKEVDWSEVYTSLHDSARFQITHEGREFRVYAGNIFGTLLRVPCVSCWTLLAKRQCFDSDIRFAENYPTWEDYWFICKLSEKQDFLFIDLPTAENRGHDGPRLTGAALSTLLRCHIDTIEKVFLHSVSDRRPPLDRIKQVYRDLHVSLYKECVKSGDLEQAESVLGVLRGLGIPGSDAGFYLYRLASCIPSPLLQKVRNTKRILDRRH